MLSTSLVSYHIGIVDIYICKNTHYRNVQITDSMAYENVDDVQRQQGCCWCVLSASPCCPCFKDMADIVLLGGDESHAGGWRLKRIHRSKEVFDTLTRIIQATNKSSKR